MYYQSTTKPNYQLESYSGKCSQLNTNQKYKMLADDSVWRIICLLHSTYCNHQFSCRRLTHGLEISVSGCLQQFPTNVTN